MKSEVLWVRWLARVAGIIAILYIAMFSLDAFGAGVPVADALIGFAIHNIPSVVLLIVLAIAWRWERLGGVLFVFLSVVPLLLLSNALVVNLALAAPFFFTGILFLISGWINP